MSGIDNLDPCRDTETARARGKQGGIKSAQVKKEKRLLSQIYADILADKTGQEKGLNLSKVIETIIEKGGAPAVSMIKEIREATEGSKINLSGSVAPVSIIIKGVSSEPSDR